MLVIVKDFSGKEIARGKSFEEIGVPYNPQEHVVYVLGSKHIMRYLNGTLRIGCVSMTMDEFARLEESLGTEYGYSAEDRAEYFYNGLLLKNYVTAGVPSS